MKAKFAVRHHMAGSGPGPRRDPLDGMGPSAILPGYQMEARKRSFADAIFFLLGVAVLVSGCKGYTNRLVLDPAPAVARLRAGGALQAEVDCLARPLVANREVFNLAVGVLTPDGAVHNFSYGRAPLPAPDTIFEIGSLTKVFVAGLVAMLVEEGRLRYEDSVRDLLPPAVKVSADVGRLTVHQLVTHTSGMPRQPNNLAQMRYFVDFVFAGRNPYAYLNRRSLFSYLRHSRLKPTPEPRYAYSNLGYGLLGELIEIKTGRPLPELVEEKICGPLQLHNTGYSLTGPQRARLAAGHVGDQPKFLRRNRPLRDWNQSGAMEGSGGLYSTVNDLMLFAQSNLGLPGQPLAARLAAMQAVQIQTPTEDVTAGWVVNHYADWDTSIHYMNGVFAGYSAYLGMDLRKRVAVVVLTSNFNWTDKLGHNLVLRLAAATAVSER